MRYLFKRYDTSNNAMPKPFVVSVLLILSLLSTTQVARGQFSNPTPYLQVTLDKALYFPGDSGTLSIEIKDTLSMNIEIYNVSITFPWLAYINGRWEGNQTITLNSAIASGNWLHPPVQLSFTVPSDSRYVGQNIFGGGGQGFVNVWSSGVGPSGGAGTFQTRFTVLTPYLELGLDWHTITYILVIMTILIGIMTFSVVYYVRASLKQKRTTLTAPPSSTSSGLPLEKSS
jgi:hypothetical protein